MNLKMNTRCIFEIFTNMFLLKLYHGMFYWGWGGGVELIIWILVEVISKHAFLFHF